MNHYNDISPLLLTDFYKTIHHLAYVPKLEYLVSYWTLRKSRYQETDKGVVFGLQGLVKEYLITEFNQKFFGRPLDEVEAEYKRVITHTMSLQASDTTEIRKLHTLGYLPIRIKAVAEGTVVNIRTPIYEISNTVKGYGWLVNYLETYFSVNAWHPINSATVAHNYRKLVNQYFDKTVSKTAVRRSDGTTEGCQNIMLNDVKASACGDFSMRGMTSIESAVKSSAAHLLSFTGTATIGAIPWLETYYGADCEKEVVGRGVPSLEHSVVCSYGRDGEFECYRHCIEDVFTEGPLSMVMDTYDYWHVLTDMLPKLKDSILNRNGKIIIRGDSGDPVDILCGTLSRHAWFEELGSLSVAEIKEYFREKAEKEGNVESPESHYYAKANGTYYKIEVYYEYEENDESSMGGCYNGYIDYIDVAPINPTPELLGTIEILWRIFGGYINDKGYKVLDPHIGAIYGDAITHERACEIYRRLEMMGFAVNNATLGIGSYTYQYVTRDSLGQALKATNAVVDGEGRQIFKDPATDKSRDNNFKKSQKGMCYVYRNEDGDVVYSDEHTFADMTTPEFADNLLELVFEDGKLIKETTLQEVRDRLNNGAF